MKKKLTPPLTTLLLLINLISLNAQSSIYWCEDNRIARSDIDGNNIEVIISDVEPAGIALDPDTKELFWSDRKSGGIFKSSLEGTDIEQVISFQNNPTDVELDIVNKKIYWGGDTLGFFQHLFYRSNYDGTEYEKFNMGDLSLDLYLRASQNLIYSIGLTLKNISKTDLLSGTTTTLLPDLNNPVSMCIDTVDNKIFFSEFSPSKIYQSNLDGTDKQLFLTPTPNTGFEHLYYDQLTQKIYGTAFRLNPLDNSLTGFIFRIGTDNAGYEILVDDIQHSSDLGNRRLLVYHPDLVNTTLQAEQAHINIFPNPVKDLLFFEVTSTAGQRPIKAFDEIAIFDVNGISVFKGRYPSTGLNLAHLADGIYFLSIKIEDRTILQKFIKGGY